MRKTQYNSSKYPVKTKRPPKGDFQKRINAHMKMLRLKPRHNSKRVG